MALNLIKSNFLIFRQNLQPIRLCEKLILFTFLFHFSIASAQNPPAQPQPGQPLPGGPPKEAMPPISAGVPSEQTLRAQDPNLDQGVDSEIEDLMAPYPYNPRDAKDPFAQTIADKQVELGALRGPLLPLQKFELKDIRLKGIIWDVSRPKVMLEAPPGQIHIVGPNAKIGKSNGYIAAIREGEIVVIETVEQDGRLLSSARVVRISK